MVSTMQILTISSVVHKAVIDDDIMCNRTEI